MNEYNGLLAADLLQNRPDPPDRPTADCASPAWGLFPDRVRTRGLPRSDTGFLGKTPGDSYAR